MVSVQFDTINRNNRSLNYKRAYSIKIFTVYFVRKSTCSRKNYKIIFAIFVVITRYLYEIGFVLFA